MNKRPAAQYCPVEWRRKTVDAPFETTATNGQFDVVVNVKGGGLTGQAEAIRLGVARALVEYNEEHRPALREAGFLTRDPRMIERKKYRSEEHTSELQSRGHLVC